VRNTPVTMINAVDTSTQTGAPIFSGQFVSGCFTSVFGDTSAAGTIKIQGSNEIPVGDPNKYVPSNASFNDIPNATSSITSGVGSAIAISTLSYQYVRAVYTSSSGGSSTVLVSGTFLGV